MLRGPIALTVALVAFLATAADKPPRKGPALTVNEIMMKAHQPGRTQRKALDQRVTEGKASDAEERRLVELYEALARAQPPSGDLADWKARTGKIVNAARAVVRREDGARGRLSRALDCTGCHNSHPWIPGDEREAGPGSR
jgi:hypothetical protein